MSDGINRQQILRIDCMVCKTRGYIVENNQETTCPKCGGSGVLEKEVPFKFESQGRWDKDEIAEAFEIPVDQVQDRGHDGGDATSDRANEPEE